LQAWSHTQRLQTQERVLESAPSSASQATSLSPPTETFLGYVVKFKNVKTIRYDCKQGTCTGVFISTLRVFMEHHHECHAYPGSECSATLDHRAFQNLDLASRTVVGSVFMTNNSRPLLFKCGQNGCSTRAPWIRLSNLVTHFRLIHGTQENKFFCPHVDCPRSQTGRKKGFVDFPTCAEHCRKSHGE
jgi:hypothetical protein